MTILNRLSTLCGVVALAGAGSCVIPIGGGEVGDLRVTWSFEGSQVPFKIEYRYRPPQYGDQLVRMFLLKNDVESKLGTTPLPDGIVRVYRDNGKDGLGFRVQQQIRYVPIGDKIELNLGPDPEVIHEWVPTREVRTPPPAGSTRPGTALVRGESLFNLGEVSLFGSGTGTVEFLPHRHLSLRVEFRHDGATGGLFYRGSVPVNAMTREPILNAASQNTVSVGVTAWF